MCSAGEPLELRHEPKNPKDEHAIAVFSSRGVQIGYVTAERAPWIGKLLGEREVRAIFQGHAKFGAWARVAFDGEEPVLPSTSDAEQQMAAVRDTANHPVFWPDPVYDEE